MKSKFKRKKTSTPIGTKGHEGNDNLWRDSRTAAFTLIELIVVMAVIGILVLLAAPKFLGYTERAQDTKYIHTAKVVETALEAYLIHGGEFPDNLEVVDSTLLMDAAANRKLIGVEGYIASPDGETYYELTYEFIKKLDVKLSADAAGDNFLIEALAERAPSAIYSSNKGITLIDKERVLKGYTSAPASGGEDVVPGDEEPDEEFVFGQCNLAVTEPSNLTYTITNGEVTITGFSAAGAGLTELNIPGEIDGYPVTTIANLSFANKGLTSICLPESLIAIGASSFKQNLITSIDLKNVTSISSLAFSENPSLKHVRINADITNTYSSTDRNQPFAGLELGNGLVFGDNVKVIPQNFFYNSGLTHVDLNNVTTVKTRAFSTNKIKSIIINKPVQVEAWAFMHNQIESVDLTNITLLGQSVFFTNQISHVEFGSTTNIPISTFASNKLTTLNLGNITTVGANAFADNDLISVDLGMVTSLGDSAFKDNDISQLTMNYPISNSYQYDYTVPFEGNQLGDGIVLGDPVKVLPRGVFRNAGVTSIDLNQVTTVGMQAFKGNSIKNLDLKNVTRVENNAFSENLIETLDLRSATFIGTAAFANNLLTSVDFKDVTEIQSTAFIGNKLTAIDLKQVAKIGHNAFQRNSELKSVLIHRNIESTYASGNSPFFENNLGSGVVIGDNVTAIPDYFFQNNGITSIDLNKVKTIGNRSFYENQLTSLFIPNSVTEIKTLSFYGNRLIDVNIDNIPGSVLIGASAFNYNGVDGKTTITPTYLRN